MKYAGERTIFIMAGPVLISYKVNWVMPDRGSQFISLHKPVTSISCASEKHPLILGHPLPQLSSQTCLIGPMLHSTWLAQCDLWLCSSDSWLSWSSFSRSESDLTLFSAHTPHVQCIMFLIKGGWSPLAGPISCWLAVWYHECKCCTHDLWS